MAPAGVLRPRGERCGQTWPLRRLLSSPGSVHALAFRPVNPGQTRPGGSAPPAPAGRHDAQPRTRASRLFPARAASQDISLFPAGQKQARVQLPALFLEVDCADIAEAGTGGEPALAAIDAAVAAGTTAVVLRDAGGTGAAALYSAAVRLKELLRERAALLLEDRTDIAAAVAAEGVVLSEAGVPVVVARKLLTGAAALISKRASTPAAAATAAADGANLVLLSTPGGAPPSAADVAAARSGQRSGSAIPVIAAAGELPSGGGDAVAAAALDALAPLAAAADGFATSLAPASTPGRAAAGVGALLQALTAAHEPAGAGGGAAGAGSTTVVTDGSTLRRLMTNSREALVREEKVLLERCLALLEDIVPQLEELSLLRDATAALDEPFLLVVVGEFNSGKSSVINALLGERFLADGILPTTNEISLLKWADASDGRSGRVEQQADGLFVRYLPAQLLQEMHIVDTPGTNVILERQQRLTEEFVPRADLVLFVLSADRPLSESELRFLQYIRQWRKKVVFVVNKVDILPTPEDVSEVLSFVSSNAQRLLQLDDPAVLPVSARAALRAKLECGAGRQAGVLDSVEDELLVRHLGWQASRFGDFERFVYDFLVGGGSVRSAERGEGGSGEEGGAGGGGGARGEGLRLKLQTPLFVADALMQAAQRQLAAQTEAAQSELASLRMVRTQVARFKAEMGKDGEAQRAAVAALVAGALSRSDAFVDRTLQLSNAAQLAGYVFGGPRSGLPVASRFDSDVAAGAFDALRQQVVEHSGWLAANCGNQLEYYQQFLDSRTAPGSPRSGSSNGSSGSGSGDRARKADGTPSPPQTSSGGAAAASAAAEVAIAAGSGPGASLVAVSNFNLNAAKTLLEEEIREAFLGTAGSAAGAQGLGLIAAGALGNTLEDVLALTIAGLASYVAVLNLPLRRAEIKSKVAKIAGNFTESVTSAMEKELEMAVSGLLAAVLQRVEPLEAAWQLEAARIEAAEARRAALADALADMERRAANVQ